MAVFNDTFATLKQALAPHLNRLALTTDNATEYSLYTRKPSPFPQHKGQPLFFSTVRIGKAYVSFHLLPLYMNPALAAQIPPALKKRMQGKACFNFKVPPDPALLADLTRLTAIGLADFEAKDWL